MYTHTHTHTHTHTYIYIYKFGAFKELFHTILNFQKIKYSEKNFNFQENTEFLKSVYSMKQKYKISIQLEKCNQAQAISRVFIEIICLASEKIIIIIIDYTCKSREIYEMTVNIT